MIDEEPIRTVVLLVEDNIDLNLAMREILESCGYEVLAAENGVQAIRVLEEQIPDVILCDIMMPEMDGYDLLRYARSEPSLRMIPFIFLTALTSTADHRRAREIGIDDYLTKPAETADLLAAINNALRRSRFMEDELRRQSDELRARIVALLQHEFRTPLTFVLGYAELLLELLNDATSQQSSTLVNSNELRISVTAILDGGKRLQRLIETFLLCRAAKQDHSPRRDRHAACRRHLARCGATVHAANGSRRDHADHGYAQPRCPGHRRFRSAARSLAPPGR